MEAICMNNNNPYSVKWQLMRNMNPQSQSVPLTVADMEFDIAHEIKEALKHHISTYALVYSNPTESYGKAVVDWFERRHNVHFNKDHMVQSTGVISALYALVETLSEPNDGILIQKPVYNQFMLTIEKTRRKEINAPLVYKDGLYTIDFDDLDAKMKEAKLMILCQPHNPVGRMYTRKELQQIADLAKKHNVQVISDEIHADFTTDKPFVSYSEFDKEAIICTAASKSFNLAALHTANIFIPNQYKRDKFNERNNKHGVNGPSILGYIATEAAYTQAESWFDNKLNIIRENYEYLKKAIQETKLVISPLEGTYLTWINYDAYHMDETEFLGILKKHDIYVSPGSSFGQTGFFRVNLAAKTQVIKDFVVTLLDVVEKL